MKQHQKINEPTPQNAAPGDPGGDGLESTQKQMGDLLSVGDAAIDAALSTDSAAFLASTQQRGGQ